jgi:hypothetical protein
VLAGDALAGAVSYWTPASSHGQQEVQFVGTHNADSFTTNLGVDGNLSIRVSPGKYRIGIVGDVDPIVGSAPTYWYVADDQGPTFTEQDATWVTVSADTNLVFEPAPGFTEGSG